MSSVSPTADLDARPWDFQAEECALRANIERFNSRRYDKNQSNPEFLPVDNCLQSVLGRSNQLIYRNNSNARACVRVSD